MLVSYQPAFGVSGVFMMDGIEHDGWEEAFEAAAGSITGIGWMKEESGLWGFEVLWWPSEASCGGLRGAEASASSGRVLNFVFAL